MSPSDNHVTDRVDDYVHGLLSPAEGRRIEEHCRQCTLCRGALGRARQRLEALTQLPAQEAGEALIHSTLRKIDEYRHRRQRLRRLLALGLGVATAAALVVLISGQIYYSGLKPSPVDLRLYGQRELITATRASMRIRLTDEGTGQPLAGVPVTIELRSPGGDQVVSQEEFRTDEQGTGEPRLQIPDLAEGDYQLRIVAQTPGQPEILTRSVTLRRAEKVMISSDKPIYQPGQKIQLRALALRRADLHPFAKQPLTFSIRDPKNNIIFKNEQQTSEFGIAASACALAPECLEGDYVIQCSTPQTSSSLTVKVFRYVLPKFKIDATLDRPYYQPGERVQGTIEARYFFGKPVAGASLAVVAVAPGTVADPMLTQLRLRADAEGKAKFDFRIPPTLFGRPQDSGDTRMVVRITATDTAGQTHDTQLTRVVTAHPLRVEAIAEGGTLVQGIPNRIYFFASYADGKPAHATLTLPEHNQKVQTSPLGVAAVEITPVGNNLALTVQAADDKGLKSERTVTLAGGQPWSDFLFRTDKAVYKSGDTMHLTILGGGQEPVFLDILKDNQTVQTAVVDVKDGRGEHTIDLSPDWFGTMQLCAYRFDSRGWPVRKTRVFYVRQASQLKVAVQKDQTEYRPGTTGKLTFHLKDRDNKPVRGALSLAAVDEAVYAVNAGGLGLEQRFYLLEQELLKPVYAIYPWSPEGGEPSEDRLLLEQALFARTTMFAGSPPPVRNVRGRSRGSDIMNEPVAVTRPSSAMEPPIQGVQGRNPHTLDAETYLAKEQEVERQRDLGLERVKFGWLGLGMFVVVGAYLALWLLCSLRTVLMMHGVCFLCLLGVGVLAVPVLWLGGVKQAAMMERDAMGGAGATESRMMELPAGRVDPERAPPLAPTTPSSASAARVREWFPETLLWQPELLTDPSGVAERELRFADSITSWRLTVSAVTEKGLMGVSREDLKVFQPFFVDLNLPVALTRGDEVTVPVTLYNYLPERQTVKVTLKKAPWFECADQLEQTVELAPNEVKAVGYRLSVKKVGKQHLQVSAEAGTVSDTVKREIEVIPDGQRIETVQNGSLQTAAQHTVTLPPTTIEGSARAVVKIYPSAFSQLVEGLDSIFHMPYGCFEQTSSTTYPNVLALDYLKKTGKRNPEIEAKARQYIHLGYQRLVSFEVSGGGFDWYGRPPASISLTAYGLMEFQDMARVHDVDPRLIERTRDWLLAQRKSDGSWAYNSGTQLFHGSGAHNTHALTAYIAWAVFSDPAVRALGSNTREYLLQTKPEALNDPYALALTCNALLVLDPQGEDAKPYLQRLESLKKTSPDGKQAWWEQSATGDTMFYGRGRGGAVETTALAVLALLRSKHATATSRAALSWIVAQKDPNGTWYSTQATVLALKALLLGTDPLGGEKKRVFEVTLGEKKLSREVAVSQAEVMQEIDLSDLLKVGDQSLTIKELTDTASSYQLVVRYHVPVSEPQKSNEPLAIQLSYERKDLRVGEVVTVTAHVVNQMSTAAPMVMLDLPIPGGFSLLGDDLGKLVEAGTIDRCQVTPRQAIVYLRGLQPGKPLTLTYRLRATMPVKVLAPGGRVYEYYDPDRQGKSSATPLTVTGTR